MIRSLGQALPQVSQFFELKEMAWFKVLGTAYF